jgi:hypothetical protein
MNLCFKKKREAEKRIYTRVLEELLKLTTEEQYRYKCNICTSSDHITGTFYKVYPCSLFTETNSLVRHSQHAHPCKSYSRIVLPLFLNHHVMGRPK